MNSNDLDLKIQDTSYRYRFHEVMALRALMYAVPSLRENGDDM